MKKIVAFLFLFLVGFTVCTSVQAQSEEIVPTPTPTEEEYVLPYPGMLQDNPLYFLKSIRDKIMEGLISDSARKVDYYILQSDKNLNAGIMLHLANKKTYISKVFDQSVVDMKKAVALASAKKTVGTRERIQRSLRKHKQVFQEIKNDALVQEVLRLEEQANTLK